jgi:hypothetical protein
MDGGGRWKKLIWLVIIEEVEKLQAGQFNLLSKAVSV